jgi:hypothetical protein
MVSISWSVMAASPGVAHLPRAVASIYAEKPASVDAARGEGMRMIGLIASYAHRLDAWLKEHVGRFYTTVLLIALVSSIVATVRGMIVAFGSQNWIAAAVTLVVDVLLIINQLAQFQEYRVLVRDRRAARKAAKGAPPPPTP